MAEELLELSVQREPIESRRSLFRSAATVTVLAWRVKAPGSDGLQLQRLRPRQAQYDGEVLARERAS